MTILPYLQQLRASVGSLIAGKGWRQAWASGNDDGYSGGTKLSRPYEQSVWVFRAIQEVAGPITGLPLKWQTVGGNDAAPPDADRDAFWSRPARSIEGRMSRNDFIEGIIAWMNLKGHAFIVMGDDWLAGRRGAESSPLLLVRPDRMRAVVHRGELLGWEFTDGGNVRHMLLPEQVRRPQLFNPYEELQGLAPMKTAEVATQSDYAAGLFAKHLMESNGDRGAYIIAKDGVVDEAQRMQIEMALRQKRELNRRGIFKTQFLTGDIKVEDPKVQSADAQFVAQRVQNRHEIYAAFGVPMSMADLTASYSIGSASDRYRLIEGTCMPNASRIAQHFETIEERRSGRTLECGFDWSQNSTMRAVRQEQAATAKLLWSMGVSLSAANDWLGLGLPKTPGDDVGYLPLNVQPVSGQGSTAKEDKPAPKPKEEEPGADIGKVFDDFSQLIRSMPAKGLQTACPECGGAHDPNAEHETRADADPARLAKWKALMAAREPSVKMVRIQVAKAINEAREETLKNLEATKALSEVKQRGVLEVIFDLRKFQLRMWSLLQGPLMQSVQDSVEQLGEEIGAEDPWVMEDPEVMAYVESRESRIKDASEEIWGDVQGELSTGLERGETNAELAKRIRAKFTGITKERSEVIANTEVGAAYGHARQKAMEASGTTHKEWLTAQDGDRVRLAHQKADGQTVSVQEKFTVDGEQLDGPGDPKGSAKNVINCRCVAVPVRAPKK